MKFPIPMMVVMAGIALAQTGCQTQQKLARNQLAAREWMAGQAAAARIQVSGDWFAEGWGRASLKQSGRQVAGTLDSYEIKGVVSGNKAYLTAWDSGECYFAIILSQSSPNRLTGSYTAGPTYLSAADEQRAIELRRSY